MMAAALAMLQIALACDQNAKAGDGSLGKLCADALCTADSQCFSGKCLPRGYFTEESICDGVDLVKSDSAVANPKGVLGLGWLISIITIGVLIFVFCIIFCFCRGVISCILDCLCCCCRRRETHHHHYEHVHHHKWKSEILWKTVNSYLLIFSNTSYRISQVW